MGTHISATDLSKNLSDVLNRVRYQGEKFTVSRNGSPIAALHPAATPRQDVTMRDLADHMRTIPLPDDGFAADPEAIRGSSAIEEPPSWLD